MNSGTVNGLLLRTDDFSAMNVTDAVYNVASRNGCLDLEDEEQGISDDFKIMGIH